MKFKLLLFSLLLSCGIMSAQDTIKTLVITEARLDRADDNYVELTNMGDAPVNLSQFEFGRIGPWVRPTEAWNPVDAYMMLPDTLLQPGATYVMGVREDWRPVMEKKDPYLYGYRASKADMVPLLDLPIDYQEASFAAGVKDSVSPNVSVFTTWNGRDCWYLRQHLSPTDSAVIDQVNGIRTGTDQQRPHTHAVDVAGVTNATVNSVLVRKFTVKSGNLDFRSSSEAKSVSESHWIPIPFTYPSAPGRSASFWTVGNHGNYTLDATTLESSTIVVNMADSILDVPWGVRRDDSLMFQFNKKPGVAWHYDYAPTHDDSAYISARTGDKLTVYVLGNTLMEQTFTIQVAEPTTSDNIVISKKEANNDGFYDGTANIWNSFCFVTKGAPGMDTIKNQNKITGIPFATRTDSLMKYLEKAPNATWEFVWVDGVQRTDLKNGDILKVTAEDGSVKEYFIKVDQYRPSHNANLSSITWPDIPNLYRNTYGFMGDTIPNFTPQTHDYNVKIPNDPDIKGIPALVAKTEALNTKVDVQRATNFFASTEARTVTFTTTAEDDTSIRVYNIVLQKEMADSNIQPWHADPFISQFIFHEQFANTYLEVVNPGTVVMDLSHYMFAWGYQNSPAGAITQNSAATNWADRFCRYIPGYKWQDSTNWKIEPAIAIKDLAVNPNVQPGDVFVMGKINATGDSGYPWFTSKQLDVDFGSHNPWNEDAGTAIDQWWGANWYLFRIENDSVLNGDKPATDPNDFTLIDVFGSGDGTQPVVGGLLLDQVTGYTRKPDVYKGNTEFNGSFGTDAESSEWIMVNESINQNKGLGWPDWRTKVADGLGTHFMNSVSVYKSTIKSALYKVSHGYSDHETIEGVVPGTTVDEFMVNIIKDYMDETMTLKAGADGTKLTGTDVLSTGDTLVVLSADSSNMTRYILTVSELSHDALLTSATYTIDVTGEVGTVTGFDFGTSLKTVYDGVTVPAGASITVIDENDAYVPFTKLNYDTLAVDVHATSLVFFEVVAEDNTTTITYTLMPNADETTALLTSDVYSVDQEASLVDFVPQGTSVSTFLSNITLSPGATVQIIDKLGMDRNSGQMMLDDKVIVTAPDGTTEHVYYLGMLGYDKDKLAFIMSDVYDVNQIMLTVSVSAGTVLTVDELIADLQAAPGATITVTSSDGVVKSGSDAIANGDIIKVTAANGVNTSNYVIDMLTGIGQFTNGNVKVYPNPTAGMVHLSGLTTGTVLSVYNSVGGKVLDKVVSQDNEDISLENQRSGLYFIMITDKNRNVLGQYKLILQ